MKKIIIILIIAQCISCGRWKTTKLKPHPLCSIASGKEAGNIMLNFDKNNILDVSLWISIQDGNILAADNILKRVSIFNTSGTPSLIIGKRDDKKTKDREALKAFFNFSIIGLIASDSEDNIYVQNRFASTSSQKDLERKNIHGFSPSYILVFNSKGSLLYTIGKRGSPDIPFNYIENMFIDNQDRLFVITKSYKTWEIYAFKNKKRLFEINFAETDFRDFGEDKDQKSKIENIVVYSGGNNFLVSVAYYMDSDFRYRKLYRYSIENKKIEKAIMSIPEHQNELYSLIDDKTIYLWDVQDRQIKFIICSMNGNIVNNIVMKFPDNNHDFYSRILIDENEQLYSYHVKKESIEILQWR